MPLTDDFDGTYPSGVTLTVTTPGGASTEVPIHGIENVNFPNRQFKVDKYTPISGVRAGKEQQVICSQEAPDMTGTLCYEKTHQIAMDAIAGVNGCAIALVMPDGLTVAGTGGIQVINVTNLEDSRHVTADITLVLNAGWTMVDAGDAIVVTEYNIPMVAGVASLDLTACGSGGAVDLTGNFITRIRIAALAGNGDAVTVAEGAANGYDPSGDAFEVVLSPGTTSDSTYSTGAAVSGTAKILDITGTGTDSINVYIESEPV